MASYTSTSAGQHDARLELLNATGLLLSPRPTGFLSPSRATRTTSRCELQDHSGQPPRRPRVRCAPTALASGERSWFNTRKDHPAALDDRKSRGNPPRPFQLPAHLLPADLPRLLLMSSSARPAKRTVKPISGKRKSKPPVPASADVVVAALGEGEGEGGGGEGVGQLLVKPPSEGRVDDVRPFTVRFRPLRRSSA